MGAGSEAVADESAALTEVTPEVVDAKALTEVTASVTTGAYALDAVTIATGTWRLEAGCRYGLSLDEGPELEESSEATELVLS